MTRLQDLADAWQAAGAKPAHVPVLARAWSRALPLGAVARDPEHSLPLALRRAWPSLSADLVALARVRSRHDASDGSARLLVGLADGETVESVLLPRAGVCVSTQVGCAVGCTFCMTGREGLRRHLGAAEIVAQVALARTLTEIRKVVFMGMGEPSHNLREVMDSIELLGTEGGVAHKNLVFSTVGDRRAFDRLPRGRVKPALAISLHSMDPDKRARLLPRAPRIEPREIVELGERYARATRYPIQYQWTLLAGVNDGDDEVDAIATALTGRYAVMNVIPSNAIDGAGFERPHETRTLTIVRELNGRGVLAKVRDSAGQDVDAGCGQLRSRRDPGSLGVANAKDFVRMHKM